MSSITREQKPTPTQPVVQRHASRNESLDYHERINATSQNLSNIWNTERKHDEDIKKLGTIINLLSSAQMIIEQLGPEARDPQRVLEGLIVRYAAVRGMSIGLLPVKDSAEERGSERVEKVENARKILTSPYRTLAKEAVDLFLENRMQIAHDRALTEDNQRRLRENYEAVIQSIFNPSLGFGTPGEHFVRLNRLWGEDSQIEKEGRDHTIGHTRLVINVIAAVQERRTVVSINNGDFLQTRKLVIDWAVESAIGIDMLTEYERNNSKPVKVRSASELLVSDRALAIEAINAFIEKRIKIARSRRAYMFAYQESLRNQRAPQTANFEDPDELGYAYKEAKRIVLIAERLDADNLRPERHTLQRL